MRNEPGVIIGSHIPLPPEPVEHALAGHNGLDELKTDISERDRLCRTDGACSDIYYFLRTVR
jgi:hypothetical protein